MTSKSALGEFSISMHLACVVYSVTLGVFDRTKRTNLQPNANYHYNLMEYKLETKSQVIS